MDNLDFNVILKRIQQKGTLAWEYNPFRNYRLDRDMIYYKDRFYTHDDFKKQFPNCWEDEKFTFNNFPKTEEQPIPYQKGQLVDFITDELQFDLNHPVQILPTYSYDDSVDLIINDGSGKPKIINSRFSARGRNTYEVVDRTGNNDTNIYDRGTQFEIDTSLYKVTTSIPELTFGGISYGGNLKVGNYHFYFKYVDADGNQSDFICESGLVSVFIGNTPQSIKSGFRDENSHKKIRFLIGNTDSAYEQLVVYYTRATSEEYQNRTIETRMIEQKFNIKESVVNIIDITGFENSVEISPDEINKQLQIYDSANTQAVCQNMLFLGNVSKSNENHNDLIQCALGIIPCIDTSITCKVDELNRNYGGNISETYYNPTFLYNYTGYWDDELYRFGVVFIQNNNTLTSVYNVRGLNLGSGIDLKEKKKLGVETNGQYNQITFDENTFKINEEYCVTSDVNYKSWENAKGVCYIPKQDNINTVIGITFKTHPEVIKKLKDLGIKGYFFVRQKRIPTTLCQAYTVGVEDESHTPMLPKDDDTFIWESFLNNDSKGYTYYDNGSPKNGNGYLLSNDFTQHIRTIKKPYVSQIGAICPDYDINSPYLNSLFTGVNFSVYEDCPSLYTRQVEDRLFEVNKASNLSNGYYQSANILGVEDNVKLVAIGKDMFSARAGEAEEAKSFEWVEAKNKVDNGGNKLLRGQFGPYLGITGYDKAGSLITIKIPDYSQAQMLDYIKIRCFDASPFYPISDRHLFQDGNGEAIQELQTCYRGDCYICKVTHRMNRNFVDPSAPLNDDIVDPSCWTKNLSYTDGVLNTENINNINLGDVNAVNLGMWVSFIVRSNINHSVKSIDNSNVDEASLFGHGRGFYPYLPNSAKAAYKIAESGCYNKGFEASVGEKVNMELPMVPYYKDYYGTRIAYSDIRTNTFFENSYRLFQGQSYRDYPMTYGSITKLVEFNGSLLCILEHGIYKIAVNERAVAAEGSGGFAYINTSNVLPENPEVISDTFGSQWIDSIIKTPNGVYGVDTIGKKIWKVHNSGQFEIISDMHIQEFLNNNITLTERELTPIIGIRNVKSHYNNFKKDVMFTFYDDLNSFEETVWNICYNEVLGKWITFYSWVPSFSENICNQYFSFDRNTSKYIAKLGLHASGNWKEGIYLDNTIMDRENTTIGRINITNPSYIGDEVEENYEYEIVRDIRRNDLYFYIDKDEEDKPVLKYRNSYDDYISSLNNITEVIYDNTKYTIKEEDGKWYKNGTEKVDSSLVNTLNTLRKDSWKKEFDNASKVPGKPLLQKVYLLNVRVTTKTTYRGTNATYEDFVNNHSANFEMNGGSIDYTIAVIPKEHLDLLSTDFWKHGQAGIIDITEKIQPTKWYGKQHPFEFEFVVSDNPSIHKIFNNLEIISNKAAPESFHYEIIGECYDFAKDKKNMYIRQEATKELYQYNGVDITYNSDYKDLDSIHRPIDGKDGLYQKSTVFPLYYRREDKLDNIEDSYEEYGYKPEGEQRTHDYQNLAGAEIVRYENLNEYRIWNHAKAVDVSKSGLLRGNMRYNEDTWKVQINSINLAEKNETDEEWKSLDSQKRLIPAECNLFKIPDNIFETNEESYINLPKDWNRNIIQWSNNSKLNKEVKMKDKFIKIRIRYSGEDLAIISAINTLYTISIS